MRITVVGLGKIGLPLAVQYAERSHQVLGADVNSAVVASMPAYTGARTVGEPRST